MAKGTADVSGPAIRASREFLDESIWRAIRTWLGSEGFSTLGTVITFLRLAGIGAAAIWLGGAVLFVLLLHPLFGETDLIRLLGPLHAGDIALRATDRFHLFQIGCASACLIITLGDWLYSGRPVDKRSLGVLVLVLGLASLAVLHVTPKCRAFSIQAYLGPDRQIQRQAVSPAQRQAERSLAVWEGLGLTLKIVCLLGGGMQFLVAASAGPSPVRAFGGKARGRS